MCTLLLYRRPFPGVVLAVAANRDELYSRPKGTFGVIGERPTVVGGIDPEAGGTWLAVSGEGFVVAVTNARLGARRGEAQRSRGLLARDLVLATGWEAAVDRLGHEDLARYAACNVLVASGEGIVVATNLPEPRVERWAEGRVGLGNTPAFGSDPRVTALLERGRPRRDEMPGDWVARVRRLMARHEEPTACHHLEHGGTVASTLVLLREPFGDSLILHANDAPCRAPWIRVDLEDLRRGQCPPQPPS